MDLFWQEKHDQRLHVYIVERIAKSPYYFLKTGTFQPLILILPIL